VSVDPVDLLFGGMGKLGPGSDDATKHVLSLVPQRPCDLVVDAGCGAGRQTLVLAETLGTEVDAVDLHQPFLDELRHRAHDQGVDHLVRTHCMDINDIAAAFTGIGLLWSEGAAYTIGFAHALSAWLPAIAHGGHLVVSELCWLRYEVNPRARDFFRSGYPDMRQVAEVANLAEQAGYRVVATYTLPRSAWLSGYYDVLAPRAAELRVHADAAVRALAEETLREIDTFERCVGDYGYVFFVLSRRNLPAYLLA
jgi:SAM-dependent methyltransferase